MSDLLPPLDSPANFSVSFSNGLSPCAVRPLSDSFVSGYRECAAKMAGSKTASGSTAKSSSTVEQRITGWLDALNEVKADLAEVNPSLSADIQTRRRLQAVRQVAEDIRALAEDIKALAVGLDQGCIEYRERRDGFE
jgi:hypothetical protein